MKTKLIALGLAALGLVASAHAAVPSEITALSTDAQTVFDAVKGVVIAVLGFFILLSIAKKLRKS